MIPLFKPFMPKLPDIQKILNSGKLSYGEYGRKFEAELSRYFDVENIMTTNTYNSALNVVLATLGIGYGDEIITSPMSCLVSTQPLAAHGIKVIWADINPETGTLDPDSVKGKVSSKTRAIIHNHYCGYVGFIDEINSIGKDAGIPVIDDCIEAFGSAYKGEKLGNCGTDVTIFSFSAIRNPNTIDGGAITFKNEELYKRALLIRDSGIDRSNFRTEFGEINPECDITLIGYNATMSELNSYIGIEQLKHINELLEIQRENANFWYGKLLEDQNIKPVFNNNTSPNYWIYGILTRDKIESMRYFESQGISSSSVHINNNIYSVFNNKEKLKGVTEFYNHFLALPSGWWFRSEFYGDK